MSVPTLLSLTKRFIVNYVFDRLSPSPFPYLEVYKLPAIYGPSRVYEPVFSTLSYEERRYVVQWIQEIVPTITKEAYAFIRLLLEDHFLELIPEEVDWILECDLPTDLFISLLYLNNHSDKLTENQCRKIISTLLKKVDKDDSRSAWLLCKYYSTNLDRDQRKQIKNTLLNYHSENFYCLNYHSEQVYFFAGKILLKYYSTDLSKNQREQIKNTFLNLSSTYSYAAEILLKYTDLSEDQRKQIQNTLFTCVRKISLPLAASVLLRYCSVDVDKVQRNLYIDLLYGDFYSAKFLLKYCSTDLSEDRKNQCRERIDQLREDIQWDSRTEAIRILRNELNY
jgi:hypothetical protein